MICTLVFVVLPIVASIAFLPSMLRSLSAAIENVTNPQTSAEQQDQLNSLLNQIQGFQK